MLAAPAASLITDDRPSSLPHQQGRALCLVSHMLLRPLLCVYLDLQPACPHTTPRYTSTILACDTQPSRTVLVCRSYWTQSRAWAHKPALKPHSLTRSSTKNALQPRTSGTSACIEACVSARLCLQHSNEEPPLLLSLPYTSNTQQASHPASNTLGENTHAGHIHDILPCCRCALHIKTLPPRRRRLQWWHDRTRILSATAAAAGRRRRRGAAHYLQWWEERTRHTARHCPSHRQAAAGELHTTCSGEMSAQVADSPREETGLWC